jgi:serine/threonine-protein kinase
VKHIGPYEAHASLSDGGMGQVWLGKAPDGRNVVIKQQHDPKHDQFLIDEANVGMRLSHPNIVETIDLVTHEGRPALVVAYVPGVGLDKLVQAGPLPAAVVCHIGAQIAEALAVIHDARDERGELLKILHRDVKPDNIIIGYDGVTRLIDLGIARFAGSTAGATRTGQVRGTLGYVAPEVLLGEGWSIAADVWALGVTLWEAALGRKAVEGTPAVVAHAIVGGKIMKLAPGESIEPRVRGAIAQLLSLEADCRPPFASDVSALLRIHSAEFADAAAQSAALVARIGGQQPPDVWDEMTLPLVAKSARDSFSGLALEDVEEYAISPEDLATGPVPALDDTDMELESLSDVEPTRVQDSSMSSGPSFLLADSPVTGPGADTAPTQPVPALRDESVDATVRVRVRQSQRAMWIAVGVLIVFAFGIGVGVGRCAPKAKKTSRAPEASWASPVET